MLQLFSSISRLTLNFEIFKGYHQQQEQSKKQNMIHYMVIIWQARGLWPLELIVMLVFWWWRFQNEENRSPTSHSCLLCSSSTLVCLWTEDRLPFRLNFIHNLLVSKLHYWYNKSIHFTGLISYPNAVLKNRLTKELRFGNKICDIKKWVFEHIIIGPDQRPTRDRWSDHRGPLILRKSMAYVHCQSHGGCILLFVSTLPWVPLTKYFGSWKFLSVFFFEFLPFKVIFIFLEF